VRYAAILLCSFLLWGQGSENVLVVINGSSEVSQKIGKYYAQRRSVPASNLCTIAVPEKENISRDQYDRNIAGPVARFLQQRKLQERVLYIVTTLGVPLRIEGSRGMGGDVAAVDSELTLLYGDMRGNKHPVAGGLSNPFFGHSDDPFTHPRFPIYLVTRLAGYDFEDVRKMIDRSLLATNRGKFVIDLNANNDSMGNTWLRTAAMLLPKDRVILDETERPIYGQSDVIGYASWGSNDKRHKNRFLDFRWLPGAVVTEFVSNDGRTFVRPPDKWIPGIDFKGSPQNLTADYIHEGATGASGHVAEPYLQACPRPHYLLPAYYSGRNLAESYYVAIPALSWQNIVVGDPLCRLGR
jgi:uncharacterized protein (TIGR03790 family)